jgi:predicted transcriptional regulator
VLDGDYTVTEPAAEDAPPEVGDDSQQGEGSEAPLAEAGGGEQAPPAEPEAPAGEPEGVTLDYVVACLRTAKTEDDLADYLDMGRDLTNEEFEQAKAVYRERLEQLQGKAGGEDKPAQGGDSGQTKVQKRTPIMDPQAAVTDDAITCLICGESFRTLTRHLGSKHQMRPEQYREAFGLSEEYPMQAPGQGKNGSKEDAGEGSGSSQGGLGERLAEARRQQREAGEGAEKAPSEGGDEWNLE